MRNHFAKYDILAKLKRFDFHGYVAYLLSNVVPGLWLKKFSTLPVFAFLVCSLIFLINPSGHAQNVSLIKEIYLSSQDSVVSIDPVILHLLRDGQFIIAGHKGGVGWAARLDQSGDTVWQFTSRLREGTASYNEAIYHSVIEMPDSSIYLCGMHPNGLGKPEIMIAHLDQYGHMLDDYFVQFPSAERKNLHFFIDCQAWHDGIMLIGHGSERNPQVEHESISFYWLMFMDGMGKITSLRKIPALTRKFLPDPSSCVLLQQHDNLYFSASDNTSSELFHFSASGVVLARRQFHGRFILVRPVQQDGLLQVYGSSMSHLMPPRQIIVFDDNLRELAKTTGIQPSGFVAANIFRLPSQSFVISGGTFGSSRHASIVHVDRQLMHSDQLNLVNAGYFDGAMMTAITPTTKYAEFLVARSILPEGETDESSSAAQAPATKRGVLLDFIRIRE